MWGVLSLLEEDKEAHCLGRAGTEGNRGRVLGDGVRGQDMWILEVHGKYFSSSIMVQPSNIMQPLNDAHNILLNKKSCCRKYV